MEWLAPMKLFEPATAVAVTKPLRDPRLTAINFVADAVNRTLDLREIADNALHAILAVMKVDAASVYIWQEQEHLLKLFASRGISESFARKMVVLRKGDDATVDEVLNGETKVIEDFTVSKHQFYADVVSAGFHSAILVPIRAHGFVVGMLALGTYSLRVFDEAEVDLIEVISNQIGNAMVHAQLQADLRASEEQYRAMVENSDDAIYIASPDGRPRYANSAFQKILGYTVQEYSKLEPLERVHNDDVESVRAAMAKALNGEAIQNHDYRLQRKDGVWIDVQCSISTFSREGDRIHELQFIVRDVTAVRQRQQQLLRRNRQLAALSTLARVANSSLKIEEIARNTLEVALESTGVDGGCIHLTSINDNRLHLFSQIGLPDNFATKVRVLAVGEGVPGMVAAKGETIVMTDLANGSLQDQPLAGQYGFKALIVVPVKAKEELLGTLGLASRRDLQFTPEVVEMVTAMGNQLGIALSNARLLNNLERKNELLRLLIEEAHHRIKNNLQMISGLLQLEANAVSDGQSVPFIRTAVTRIQAIAQVHNLLSEEMPEKVDAHTLIHTIINSLIMATPSVLGAPTVSLEVEHLWLSADQAVPLALVVNELVANALLHGRVPARGQLCVEARCYRDGPKVRLIVCDNGGGLPEGKHWRELQGQGMSIVAQLAVVNLRGALDIKNHNGGVCAELEFDFATEGPVLPRNWSDPVKVSEA